MALVLPKAVRRPLPTNGDGSWAQKVLELGLRRRYGMTGRACTYPLYHAAGINYAMATNRVGAASILMRKIHPEAVLRLIETHRVTHAKFVPTMFVRMLKLPEAVRPSYDVSRSSVCDPRGRSVPGGRQAPDDEVARTDHPRVLQGDRWFRGIDDRSGGVACRSLVR